MQHQNAIIYEMLMIEDRLRTLPPSERYAMMSDKPGAGKTFAILAFIYFKDKIVLRGQKHNVNLIVVPYNICTQWKQSMERIYGPSGRLLKYKVLIDYADIMRLYVTPEEVLEYDILLTTSLYFESIASTLNSLKLTPRRVFFDEADTIQNLLKTPLKCQTTWFVSASMESLFHNNKPTVIIGNYNLSMDHLRKHDVRCDPEFVNENIVLDPPLVHKARCKNIYYNLLKEITDPRHIDRLAAMDYRHLRNEYVRDMAAITTEYEASLYVLKTAIAKEEYATQQISSLKSDYNHATKMGYKERAQDLATQIDALEHIVQECQRIQSTVKFFCSQHDIAFSAFEDISSKKAESKSAAIINIISDLLKERPRAQCILFANYDHIYTIMKPTLDKHGITYKTLDGGNISTMDDIINAYKQKAFSLLLADSSMYSCGMNLENTDDIIFVHRMDPLREKQVIGRAHRYGREKALNIWYVDYYNE